MTDTPGSAFSWDNSRRLRAVVWFRLCIGAPAFLLGILLLISCLVGQISPPEKKPMFDFESLMLGIGAFLALAGTPSLVIAIGILRRRIAAVYVALIFDAIVVLASIALMAWKVVGFATQGGWDIFFGLGSPMAAAPAFVFAIEAAYLSRNVWGWRRAWLALGSLAAGIVLLGAIAPACINRRLISHVRPLLTYVDAHWVRIPRAASILVEAEPGMSGPHTDKVDVETRFVSLVILAKHGKDGRWHFPAGDGEDGALRIDTQKMYIHGNSMSVIRIDTTAAARKLLWRAGVVDRRLNRVRVVKTEYGGGFCRKRFEFGSTPAGGVFVVDEYEPGEIRLYLKKPLDVP